MQTIVAAHNEDHNITEQGEMQSQTETPVELPEGGSGSRA